MPTPLLMLPFTSRESAALWLRSADAGSLPIPFSVPEAAAPSVAFTSTRWYVAMA
jgi:hypothetical protein